MLVSEGFDFKRNGFDLKVTRRYMIFFRDDNMNVIYFLKGAIESQL